MNGSSGRSVTTAGGHNLPQIPTMSINPRKAVSKASAKDGDEDMSLTLVQKLEASEERKDALPCTPTKREGDAEPLSSMPTPPSEPSPGDEKKARESPASEQHLQEDGLIFVSPIVITPIRSETVQSQKTHVVNETLREHMEKLAGDRIKRENELNRPGESQVVENLGPGSEKETGNGLVSPPVKMDASPALGCLSSQSTAAATVSSGVETLPKRARVKTKGYIKKQLLKKRSIKSEVKEESSETSKDEIAKATLAKRAVLLKDEKVAGATHLLGDMFWGKVGGHPWWPCMVAYDPFEGIYYKNTGKVHYHVQFFGEEEERAWVSESRLVPYISKEQHLQWLSDKRKAASKSCKKMYDLPSCRRRAWNVACLESEDAIHMDRAARRAQYTLVYAEKSDPESPLKADTQQGSSSSNKKRKLSQSGTEVEASPPKKKQRRTSVAESDPLKLPDPTHVQFLVYSAKKRDVFRRQHPGFTEAKLTQMLKQQWDKLSDDERSKYIPMGSDVTDLSLSEKGVMAEDKKSTKPSKKKSLPADSAASVFKGATKKKSLPAEASSVSTKKLKSSADGSLDSEIDEVIDRVIAGEGDIPDMSSISYRDGVLVIDEEADVASRRRCHGDVSSQASSVDSNMTTPEGQGVMLDGKYFEPEIFNLVANPSVKREPICEICEEEHGEMVTCEGVCQGSYHVSCLGLFKRPAGVFKCDACTTENHTCFVCKECGNSPRKCSAPSCGKFYHDACLRKFPNTRLENNRLICPLHTCATCATLDKDSKATKGKFYRCVRCPTAYHVGDFCIAAGSLQLAGQHIVCSSHFQPVQTNKHHTLINVPWCFACSSGGSLICCEACPASYHPKCLENKPESSEAAWYCDDCKTGRKPLYGDIVWIKFGAYRWWPGEICHPDNVPTNIQDKPHQVGEFPVRFFGTGEFTWLTQSRVFLFQEDDRGCKETNSGRSLDKGFRKSLQEATLAYRLCKEFKERMEEKQQSASDKKPAPYKHIKVNQAVGDVQILKADPSELSRCDCDPTSDNPCGSDSDCINRMTLEECHPDVCLAGDKCQNQRFQKRQYPSAEPHRFSASSGWGLKALVDIKKGDFVNEYVGDLIDEEECRRRIKQMFKDNQDDFYFLSLDTNRIIDAGPKGNLSRFMNHSCNPNCVTQKWTVNGDTRVGLFASQNIAAGSELTFNYNLDCLGNEKKKCHCGAANCSGYLGLPPKHTNLQEKLKVKKKKKRVVKPKKRYEDECYRCGYGGKLVMCDQRTCPKVYHLKCLTLEKLPHGSWMCPWHHCDDCGKRAVKLCEECPNSFCNLHIEGNIFKINDGRLVCSDHEEILKASESLKLENEPNSKPPSSTSCSDASTPVSDSDTELATGASSSSSSLVTAVLKAQMGKRIGGGGGPGSVSESSEATVEMLPVKKRATHRRTLEDAGTVSTSRSSSPASQGGAASPGGKRRKSRGGARTPSTASPDFTQAAPLQVDKPADQAAPLSKPFIDSPMFDDTDSSDENNLVIDIP